MRHLLNTLYVLTPENSLSVDNDNVVVRRGEKVLARFPLHTLEAIYSFTYAGGTPALMGACAEHGINLVFFSPFGKFLARTVGEERGNVLLRMTQFRIADNKTESVKWGRNFIVGKLYNQKWVLERATRDHPERVPVDEIKKASAYISESMRTIRLSDDPGTLQGIEGKAAQVYFQCFGSLILQQKEDFIFETRNRRPPLDRVNALLSFVYMLLTRECEAALEAVGLDPYIGFIHRQRPGRCSLALDLVEELRASLADRFVLYCINQKVIHANDFDIQESGAIRLNENGRKILLAEWQNRKKDMITHPFLKEKINWGLIPYVQSLLLARALRGDMEEYPPFFWK